MITSIVIFAGVALSVAPADPDPLDPTVLGALLLLGVAESAFALVGAPLVLGKQPAQTAWIIRFACMEAAALFGFVAYYLGAHLPGAALMGWAMLGQFLLVPTSGRVEAWDAARPPGA